MYDVIFRIKILYGPQTQYKTIDVPFLIDHYYLGKIWKVPL